MKNILNTNVFIVGATRTPIGKFQGYLSETPVTELSNVAISGAIKKSGNKPDEIDYVILGNMLTAGVGMTPARQAAVLAGLPVTTPALTVNNACASGMQAVIIASQNIQLQECSTVLAGGMENMSKSPHILVNSRTGTRMGNDLIVDTMINDGLWCPFENRHMGDSAEVIAKKYSITREQQDAFAENSHLKALNAKTNKYFNNEITPITVTKKKSTSVVSDDEGPRKDINLEKLNSLKAMFNLGKTVTSGNASQISDGASAMVVCNEKSVKTNSGPIALITGYSYVANEPGLLFDAPYKAVEDLLQKTGGTISDFDLIEINEAFSAQVLANEKKIGWDRDIVNIHGGAIALGHPVGASGARIITTLIHALSLNKLNHGLAIICHGGGGAAAMSLELV